MFEVVQHGKSLFFPNTMTVEGLTNYATNRTYVTTIPLYELKPFDGAGSFTSTFSVPGFSQTASITGSFNTNFALGATPDALSKTSGFAVWTNNTGSTITPSGAYINALNHTDKYTGLLVSYMIAAATFTSTTISIDPGDSLQVRYILTNAF